MFNSFSFQHSRQGFRNLDRYGSHQNRPAHLVAFHDLVYYGIVFFPSGSVNHVIVIYPSHRLVGGNYHHVELVNVPEFARLGLGCPGHSS